MRVMMMEGILGLSAVDSVRGTLVYVRKELIDRDLVLAVLALHFTRVLDYLKRDLVKHGVSFVFVLASFELSVKL